jgi:hypothetical protein
LRVITRSYNAAKGAARSFDIVNWHRLDLPNGTGMFASAFTPCLDRCNTPQLQRLLLGSEGDEVALLTAKFEQTSGSSMGIPVQSPQTLAIIL